MSLNKPWLALEGFCPGCEKPLGIHGICTTCKHTISVETKGEQIWVTALWGEPRLNESAVVWTGKAPEGPQL